MVGSWFAILRWLILLSSCLQWGLIGPRDSDDSRLLYSQHSVGGSHSVLRQTRRNLSNKATANPSPLAERQYDRERVLTGSLLLCWKSYIADTGANNWDPGSVPDNQSPASVARRGGETLICLFYMESLDSRDCLDWLRSHGIYWNGVNTQGLWIVCPEDYPLS